MVNSTFTKESVLALLSAIPDPEIPVVSIQEMGMLRDVIITDGICEVIITPTYSGCPAMGMIQADILTVLATNDIKPAKVTMVYAPAWTTDWMTDEAKVKLKKYGIAPPLHSSCSNMLSTNLQIACPQCGSTHTQIISQFGSTACKALYKCNTCKEPFEYFKCH
jgi:ring-1,2-phenylacetyl-CoA epoxidase subunit PaaD